MSLNGNINYFKQPLTSKSAYPSQVYQGLKDQPSSLLVDSANSTFYVIENSGRVCNQCPNSVYYDKEINQLRAFVAVCDQGSFSGAARELNRAQSAISHAIKALESAFDVELFERNTRKATLTAAGRSLLPDARAVISRTEEMKTRAVSIAEAGVPQVSIAVDT